LSKIEKGLQSNKFQKGTQKFSKQQNLKQ